jgi:hypothetical protein
MMDISKLSAWELGALQVIGSLLYDDRLLFERVVYGNDLLESDLPATSHYQLTLDALKLAYRKNEPLKAATVFQYTNGIVPIDWLKSAEEFLVTDDEATAVARAVIDKAETARKLRELDSATRDIRAGKDPREVADRVTRKLSQVRATELDDPRTPAIYRQVSEKAQQTEGEITVLRASSPMDWLNVKLNGGVRRERLIAIGGGEKSRKTTLLRNIYLSLARSKQVIEGKTIWTARPQVNLVMCCFENSREITFYDYVAMLAFEYLFDNKWHLEPAKKASEFTLGDFLDGEQVQDAHLSGEWNRWPVKLKTALDVAFDRIQQLNLSIYDRSDQYGGLTSRLGLNRVINMHAQVYTKPDDHLNIAIDYIQLVNDTGDEYKDLKMAVNDALTVATNKHCTVWALSQFNREYKKNKRDGTNGDVMGTKGGADLEQAVHNYLEVEYNEDSPDTLYTAMRRARRGPGSKNEKGLFKMHPASGMIVSYGYNSY